MKVIYLLFFICLTVDAQRRSVKSELSESDSASKPTRRGRARFVVPPQEQQIEEEKPHEPITRRVSSRRRPEAPTSATPVKNNYEVEEVVDDTPLDKFKKFSKTKATTEANTPPVGALFLPSPSSTENLVEAAKNAGESGDSTTSSVSVSPSSETASLEFSSSEISKIENEISKTSPETTTPLTAKPTRRNNGRSRSNGNSGSSPTVASSSRSRSRTRPTRKPLEEQAATSAPTRTVQRGSRRRPESSESRSRGPSVIVAAETVELPTRSRTGRKIPYRRVEETKSDIAQPSRKNSHSNSNGNRRNFEVTTARARSRSRVRDTPPIIDEQKLEVLPLFERETKTVKPVRKVITRKRNLNTAEEVETSATENDVKVAPKPPKQSVVVETRTESSIKRRRQTSKPITKESVVSQITEVTSKRTVIRKVSPKSRVVEPKFVPRGGKKSEVNLAQLKKNKSGLTSSEEEIDDEANYPEPFKALIQAKKQKKESRPQHRLVTALPTVTKTTEKATTSSPSTTTQVISSEASRQREDAENELDSTTAKPSRRRLPQSTTQKVTRPTRKNKVVRSTTSAPLSVREHRFHAKFNNEPEATTASPVKPTRSFSPKPPRGLYSSRKTKESYSKNKSSAGQIPTPKKSNRYSSRYRNDGSSRGAIRTSTNAPAYLPTIPSYRPSTTLEYVWPEEENVEYNWSFSRLN